MSFAAELEEQASRARAKRRASVDSAGAWSPGAAGKGGDNSGAGAALAEDVEGGAGADAAGDAPDAPNVPDTSDAPAQGRGRGVSFDCAAGGGVPGSEGASGGAGSGGGVEEGGGDEAEDYGATAVEEEGDERGKADNGLSEPDDEALS